VSRSEAGHEDLLAGAAGYARRALTSMGEACSSGATGASTRDVPIIRIVTSISVVTTSASAKMRDAAMRRRVRTVARAARSTIGNRT
jgi:hypothetical protein